MAPAGALSTNADPTREYLTRRSQSVRLHKTHAPQPLPPSPSNPGPRRGWRACFYMPSRVAPSVGHHQPSAATQLHLLPGAPTPTSRPTSEVERRAVGRRGGLTTTLSHAALISTQSRLYTFIIHSSTSVGQHTPRSSTSPPMR